MAVFVCVVRDVIFRRKVSCLIEVAAIESGSAVLSLKILSQAGSVVEVARPAVALYHLDPVVVEIEVSVVENIVFIVDSIQGILVLEHESIHCLVESGVHYEILGVIILSLRGLEGVVRGHYLSLRHHQNYLQYIEKQEDSCFAETYDIVGDLLGLDVLFLYSLDFFFLLFGFISESA
jgi:hypothetical protein